VTGSSIYEDGTYLAANPTWHGEDAPWKAAHVARILERNGVAPSTVVEVGCGAGGVLAALGERYGAGVSLKGYEVSPQAFERCRGKAGPNLTFVLGDFLTSAEPRADVLVALDVIEHVEDCYGFLRGLRERAEYKVFHIPLDLSVQTVLRASPILAGRAAFGHIHYFTRETALAALADTGYRVVEEHYTAVQLEAPDRGWKANLLRIPRRVGFALHRDLTVRVLGGYSLMVLAR
jgi:SAM-dependent methyltransferase